MTASATSSGVPIRPSGICETRYCLVAFACSVPAPPNAAFRPGVSVVPALTALTGCLTSQLTGPGAGEGTHGRLGRRVHPEAIHPFHRPAGSRKNHGSMVVQKRQRLLHGEDRALHMHAEQKIQVAFGDLPQRSSFPQPGVGEQHVHPPSVPVDRLVQAVQVCCLSHVPGHTDRTSPDRGDRSVHFFFAAAGQIDNRSFFGEAAGSGQADPRRAARDHRGLAVELSHESSR